MRLRSTGSALLAAALGCSTGAATGDKDAATSDATHPADVTTDLGHPMTNDAGEAGCEGGVVTVAVVTKAHLTAAAPSMDVEATVPAGCWSSVKVRLTASSACGTPPLSSLPAPCDPYDRLAQVTLADPGKTPMFVLDAVTSFGGSATWTQDVTDYVSLLEGKHTYHLEIDTYDDPGQTGSASSHDATLSILLTPGTPPHDVVLAVPIFRADITGTPDAGDVAPLSATITAPSGATAARFDYFTSGHGGNGPYACDEFCPKENDVSLDGTNVYTGTPTSNCGDNCTHVPITTGSVGCGGETFVYYCMQNPEACPPSATYPRSNWCPSQVIAPIPITLPMSALSGAHDVGVSVMDIDGTWSVGLSAVFYR